MPERGRPRPPVADAGEDARAPASGHFVSPNFAFQLEEKWKTRGYLPHLELNHAIQFVTFRLADSLPAEIIQKLHGLDSDDEVARWRETEAALDQAHGGCVLRRPECAKAFLETLLRFDGERFVLHAWCVMPNHVHVLLHALAGHGLPEIIGGWKSVSARRIHQLAPDTAPHVWQNDRFDRFIRNRDHYLKTVRYIHENPVKAGLVTNAADWPWSSASAIGRAGTPALRHEGEGALKKLRARLRAPLDERAAKALERGLVARPAHPAYVNLADNDYLGLARDPAVIAAGKAALDKWGASSAASPLITGYTGEHAALERELAEWCGFSQGLVWNTGFAANAAVLGTLPKPGDLVLADRLIHASMISGILASGARLVRYAHNDLEKLRELLERHRDHEGVVWVVTESVFSMDGDYPDLKTLASLKNEYGFVLVVDEAHATGWFGGTGAGLVEREGIADSVDILVGTLGKGLGGFGAYTLFHDELFRRHLMNFAGEFVYSTYLPPACAASARTAIRRVREIHAGARASSPALATGGRGRPRSDNAGEDARAPTIALPAEVSRRWREAIRAVVPDTPVGDSPVIPVPLGGADRAMEVSAKLLAAGWKVGAVRPPTVPEGGARLRISLRLGLAENAPEEFAGALREALRK